MKKMDIKKKINGLNNTIKKIKKYITKKEDYVIYNSLILIYENKLFKIIVYKEIIPLVVLVITKKITRYISISIILSLNKKKLHNINVYEFIRVFDYYLFNKKNNLKIL